MHDPLNPGRRVALRAVGWQAGAVALLALGALASGPRHALAAGVGGLAVLLGGLASARLMLGGGIAPAEQVLGRWFLGVIAKWVLVFAVLVLGFGAWRLPPVPLLLGIVVALVAQVFAATRR
ncbi:hypothetical protein SD81_016560 [Tolypothrix campylonemoides VB511288]|nr:hypothetical protein SD81_016560 [Tolypothrix campylonemoides VB511288]